jgi:hypothetical protein
MPGSRRTNFTKDRQKTSIARKRSSRELLARQARVADQLRNLEQRIRAQDAEAKSA